MPYNNKSNKLTRIIQLTQRLFRFEKIEKRSAADEYGVDPRTIHRDMDEISQIIPLDNRQGVWWIDRKTLSERDLFRNALMIGFARNLRINMECLEGLDIPLDIISYAIDYSALPRDLGREILQAIATDRSCRFHYRKHDGSSVRNADPVKLYTEDGQWYLIARNHSDDLIKHYKLSRISNFTILQTPRALTSGHLDRAGAQSSVWSSDGREPFEVLIYIDKEVAHYFGEIRLHPSQSIVSQHTDGALELHYTITHPMELLPAIKRWLPHIHILKPRELHDELLRELETYMQAAANILC